MIKQAVLFIASTGLLVYFVMPADETEPKETVTQAKTVAKPVSQTNPEDSWDSENGDDDAVFGEPLTYDEEDEPAAEDATTKVPVKAPASLASKVARKTYNRAPVFRESPKPGELGSKENPVNLSPPGSR